MNAIKSVFKIIFARITGFLVFLVVLGVANILMKYIDNYVYVNIVQFFNINILLLFILMLVFMIAEVFWALIFPFNLLAPFFSAVASLFLIEFLFKILILLGFLTRVDFYEIFRTLYLISLPLVFVIVLIAGYIKIMLSVGNKKVKIADEKEDAEWKDVGAEFKGALRDFLRRVRGKINSGDEKKRRKK